MTGIYLRDNFWREANSSLVFHWKRCRGKGRRSGLAEERKLAKTGGQQEAQKFALLSRFPLMQFLCYLRYKGSVAAMLIAINYSTIIYFTAVLSVNNIHTVKPKCHLFSYIAWYDIHFSLINTVSIKVDFYTSQSIYRNLSINARQIYFLSWIEQASISLILWYILL